MDNSRHNMDNNNTTEPTTMATLKLQSSDGEMFKLSLTLAKQSNTIKGMIEDLCLEEENMSDDSSEPVPLPNVDAANLTRIIQWCEQHKEEFATATAAAAAGAAASYSTDNDTPKTVLTDWQKDFLAKLELGDLFSLLLAANYLDIKSLLDATCMFVAEMLKGKEPEQIREKFNIEDDMTPEEKEEIRKENAWIEDK